MRLLRDRRGVGAVEFALLAPILLMLYICAFEITVGLSVAKRATRATGTVADLVTQNKKVDKAYLATMASVANNIFLPYAADVDLKISGVDLDDKGAGKVGWSWQKDKTTPPYQLNSPVNVPGDLQLPDTFLVRTELSVKYPLMMFLAESLSMSTTEITMQREYFFRQRLSERIACTDC